MDYVRGTRMIAATADVRSREVLARHRSLADAYVAVGTSIGDATSSLVSASGASDERRDPAEAEVTITSSGATATIIGEGA
jgi:hypothetical protein